MSSGLYIAFYSVLLVALAFGPASADPLRSSAVLVPRWNCGMPCQQDFKKLTGDDLFALGPSSRMTFTSRPRIVDVRSDESLEEPSRKLNIVGRGSFLDVLMSLLERALAPRAPACSKRKRDNYVSCR